ncbi:MAG: Transaldolase [Actinomycetota bacterium]|jgi:transaldolase
MNTYLDSLNIKLFADGADFETMIKMASHNWIHGLTTNPTLMRKAGVENYKNFALKVLADVKEKPISFEVFSDDFDEMVRQATEISKWGSNVNVKIPITNSQGKSTAPVIKYLADNNVKLNITAILEVKQVDEVKKLLNPNFINYISIFAGRIADTGLDPVPIMEECLDSVGKFENIELIWASPREILNVIQADAIGCHIITATSEILNKLSLLGKNLNQYSLETVQMFCNDAKASAYFI